MSYRTQSSAPTPSSASAPASSTSAPASSDLDMDNPSRQMESGLKIKGSKMEYIVGVPKRGGRAVHYRRFVQVAERNYLRYSH